MSHPDILYRGVTKRAVRMEQREVDFIASTEAIDAHGTIVKQNWDLRRYRANPVVLWAHDSAEMPLGRGAASVFNRQLLVTVTFATADINPKAEQVLRACDADMVRGMSVGFLPGNVTYDSVRDVYLLDENELYEVSICPVPSNPEAVRRSLLAMAIGARCGAPTIPAPAPPARVSGVEMERVWREISGLPPVDTIGGSSAEMFARFEETSR
jgi:HK97 family phage prohead protease